MEKKVRILFIEDNTEEGQLVIDLLSKSGCSFIINTVNNRENLERDIQKGDFDLILSESVFQEFEEKAFLSCINSHRSGKPWIVLTCNNAVETAVFAMKLGAAEYLIKSDPNFGDLARIIRKTCMENALCNDTIPQGSDTSPQYPAQELIRDSEERFRMVFENVFDGIAIYDENPDPFKRKLIECNEQYASMAGRTREELLRLGSTQHLQITVEDNANEARLESLSRKQVFRGSFSWIRPDGKENFIEYAGVPIIWRGKSYSIGIDRDVTAQVLTKVALKKSEAYIKAVMDNLPIGVAVNSIEPNVNFEYINDNFLKFYRTTREALTGQESFWECVYEDPDFRKVIKERVLNDCATGVPDKMHWEDVPITRKGSDTTYVNAQNTVIPGTHLMISTVWDVTDRRRYEEKLRESEEKFRSYIENAPDGIFVADSNGSCLLANEAGCRLTGYNPEELKEIKFLDIIHPDDKPLVLQHFNLLMNVGNIQSESRMIRKNGDIRYWTVKAVKLKDDRLLGFANDITEIKHAEAEIYKLNQELEKRVEEKTIQLKERVHELERFHDATINRELRMKELRDELEQIKKQQNQHGPG